MKTAPLLYALLASTLLALPAHAADDATPKVNGVTIPQSRIDVFTKMAAPGQPDTAELRAKVRDHLITQEVLAQEAAKRGLDKTPEGTAQLDLVRQQALAQMYLQDYARKNPISEDAVKKEYERAKADIGTKEYHARHILVKSEDEAKGIIAQLKKGASFQKLAEEKSIDGSKSNGGDLGWAGVERYVPQFSAALKKLKKGQTTDAPVQTQFGWHVIRLEDERARKFPAYEEVKPQIQNQLQQQAVQKAVEDLRAKAKVE
ncbi:MAG: peptidylprolyl isomerase [Rhodospirillaceae bacterium]